ncbi:MAG: glycosyltransferase [Candidatus Peribacteraceae bacterium]|nr:glycosyltransferase [Candidatus Peribacteraceae bacterium]
MRILFSPAHYIYADFRSEVGTTFDIVDRLCKHFPDSTVIAGQSPLVGQKPYEIIEVQTKKELDVSFFNAAAFAIAYMRAEWRALRAGEYGLLYHVRPFTPGATFNLLPLLPRHRSLPFIVGPFALPYSRLDPDGKNLVVKAAAVTLSYLISPLLKALSFATLRRADVVLVEGRATKEYLSKHIDERKIHVIPPAKDGRLFSPRPGGPDGDQLRILCVGSLIRRKGIDLTIRALAAVAPRFPTISLAILGAGEERGRLEALAAELGVLDRIEFLGLVDYALMPERYRSSDLVVHMAREEMYANVFVEAMASGLPILSSDTIGGRSVVAEDFIVAQEDWPGLAEKIVALASNRSAMAAAGARNRRFFEETHDWETAVFPRILTIVRSVAMERKTDDVS